MFNGTLLSVSMFAIDTFKNPYSHGATYDHYWFLTLGGEAVDNVTVTYSRN